MRVLYFCRKVTPTLLKKLQLEYGAHEVILIQYYLTTDQAFLNPVYTHRIIHDIKIETVKCTPNLLLNIQARMTKHHTKMKQNIGGYLKKYYYLSLIIYNKLIFCALRITPDIFFTKDKSFYWERKTRYDADLTVLNGKILYKS